MVKETLAFPVKSYNLQQSILNSKGMLVCEIKKMEKINFRDQIKDGQEAIGEKLRGFYMKIK